MAVKIKILENINKNPIQNQLVENKSIKNKN